MVAKLVVNVVIYGLVLRHLAAAHYVSEWGVCVKGGDRQADKVAQRHGFINLGKIHTNCYHFRHPGVHRRSADANVEYHEKLTEEEGVEWAEQQRAKRRVKRDFLVFQSHNWKSGRAARKSRSFNWNDPRWPQMWYLNRGNGLDMNVKDAWDEGITGRGVVVTILDDGLEKDHPDIVKNYDPLASYDVNSHDEDPMPRYDLIDTNRHGTRCAGEVAAVGNNTFCAVGVAWEAGVGGVRMLDGDVTDAVEARSLSLNPQHIDIYSASWGPDDDGKTVDGPGELAVRAFVEGVSKGRGGKGSIFVWASGNGGRDNDNCNCDGYTNSIWTLSISSATETGMVPWYSEACSSTLATTYSSGSPGEKQIVTTDLHHSCTSSHTGTSASAPLAAGICALALHANRNLTWRDMQHIVVRTAKPANLRAPDWQTNGVGKNVSHSFGYGLMDAGAMVKLARIWKTAPEQHKCEVPAPHVDKFIPAKSQVTLQLQVLHCPGVNFLEHVQAKVTLSAGRRGEIQIYLTSPAGTRSTLLARRTHDNSRAGFQAWPFMTVHCWGESPFGVWTLEIHNEGRYTGRAVVHEWSLRFHGTAENPEAFLATPSPPPPTPSPTTPTPTPPPSSSRFSLPKRPPPVHSRTAPARNVNRSKAKNISSQGGQFVMGKGRKATTTSTTTSTTSTTTTSTTTSTTPPTTTTYHTPVYQYPREFSGVLYPYQPPRYESEHEQHRDNPWHHFSYMPHSSSSSSSSLRPPPPPLPPPQQPNRVVDQEQSDSQHKTGSVSNWSMDLHGTETATGPVSSEEFSNKVPGKKPLSGLQDVPESPDETELQQLDQQGKAESLDPFVGRGADHGSNQMSFPSQEASGGNEVAVASAASCQKVSDTGACLECPEGLLLLHSSCVTSCPEHFFGLFSSSAPNSCVPCHYSCRTCSGSNDYQCTSCFGDAQLWPQDSSSQDGTGFCYPRALLRILDSSNRWYVGLLLALGINLAIVMVLGAYMVCGKWTQVLNAHAMKKKKLGKYRVINGESAAHKVIEFSSDDEGEDREEELYLQKVQRQ